MSLHADMIWEFRPTVGNNNNGGAFKQGATGTDYSQQSSPQVSYTDLVIDGADNTKVTSALNPFSAAHVGNVINVMGGTGFTAGRYEVVSVAGNIATLDRAAGTVSSTGGTGNLGGALDFITDSWMDNDYRADGASVNRIYIKNTGTMTISENITSANKQGTDARQCLLEGYNATRGDAPAGNNRPLINLGANSWDFDQNCQRWSINHLRFTSSSTNAMATANASIVQNCKFSSTGGSGKYAVLSGGNFVTPQSGVIFIDCEITNPGGTAVGLATQSYVGGMTIMIGCWIHDCLLGMSRQGSNFQSVYLMDCIFQNCSNSALTGISITYKFIKNCTFYGASIPTGTAVNVTFAPVGCVWINNIFYGWSFAIGLGTGSQALYADYNNFFNNTTDRLNAVAGPHDTALDPQFVAVGSNNFSVGTNMKGIGAPGLIAGSGTVSYLDVGAAQRQEPLADYPVVGNVRSGIVYNDGGSVGTLTLPAPTDVKNTVQYGAGGNELTGSYVPTPLTTLSIAGVNFDSKLLDDAKLAFLNASEFAEVISYTPFGGAAKLLSALIVRERLESKGPDHSISITRGAEIFVANDAVSGVTSINKNNDKVSFPVQIGGPPVIWTVVEILQHDEGMWHLRVIR